MLFARRQIHAMEGEIRPGIIARCSSFARKPKWVIKVLHIRQFPKIALTRRVGIEPCKWRTEDGIVERVVRKLACHSTQSPRWRVQSSPVATSGL